MITGLICLGSGCASTPSHDFHQSALALGFEPLLVQGGDFSLQAYRNSARGGKSLHIYFGGDGTPWIDNAYIARDPTPRDPVMLSLLAMDNQPAVYLGRPCYHRRHAQQSKLCQPDLWTHARYSETVVAAMTAAVDDLISRAAPQHAAAPQRVAEPQRVALIGFSGGGVLALLVAQRLERVSSVITLGANLDIAAWTRHHRVLPLSGSINPADIRDWRKNLQQTHYIGDLDTRVPPATQQNFIEWVPQAVYITLPEVDHACCWRTHWQSILQRLNGDWRNGRGRCQEGNF